MSNSERENIKEQLRDAGMLVEDSDYDIPLLYRLKFYIMDKLGIELAPIKLPEGSKSWAELVDEDRGER